MIAFPAGARVWIAAVSPKPHNRSLRRMVTSKTVNRVNCCKRLKVAVREVCAAAIDVDGEGVHRLGDRPDSGRWIVRGALYHHSYTRKGEPGVSDRFRVILPQALPRPAAAGPDSADYQARYFTLVESLIGATDSFVDPAWDTHGAQPEQIMYASVRADSLNAMRHM